MIIVDFNCPKCGVKEHLVDSSVQSVSCCKTKALRVISAPKVVGCDSFNPHFDQQLGRHFNTAEEKKAYLKSAGKEQISGPLSPRKSYRSTSVICSSTQAKSLIAKRGTRA